jgi:hypothetical protein
MQTHTVGRLGARVGVLYRSRMNPFVGRDCERQGAGMGKACVGEGLPQLAGMGPPRPSSRAGLTLLHTLPVVMLLVTAAPAFADDREDRRAGRNAPLVALLTPVDGTAVNAATWGLPAPAFTAHSTRRFVFNGYRVTGKTPRICRVELALTMLRIRAPALSATTLRGADVDSTAWPRAAWSRSLPIRLGRTASSAAAGPPPSSSTRPAVRRRQ